MAIRKLPAAATAVPTSRAAESKAPAKARSATPVAQPAVAKPAVPSSDGFGKTPAPPALESHEKAGTHLAGGEVHQAETANAAAVAAPTLVGRDEGTGIDLEKLHAHMEKQRWYGGKGQPLVGLSVVDHKFVDIPGAPDGMRYALTEVKVEYKNGKTEFYNAPLKIAADGSVREAMEIPKEGDVVLSKPDAAFAQYLFQSIRGQQKLDTSAGDVFGKTTKEGDRVFAKLPKVPEVHPLPELSSNTVFVFGDTAILKVVRKLESGISPETEIGSHLANHGFKPTPALLGTIEGNGPVTGTIAYVHQMESVQGDAYGYLQDQLKALPKGSAVPKALVDQVRDLGRITGEFHATMGNGKGDPDVKSLPMTSRDVKSMAAMVQTELDVALKGPNADPELKALGPSLQNIVTRMKKVDPTGSQLTRINGDYHLGQALRTKDGQWKIADFEGEPARTAAERRMRSSPLRDVAGMMSSFRYLDDASGTNFADDFRKAFLEGYLSAVKGKGLVPEKQEDFDALLQGLMLQKHIYERRYELNNRPEKAGVPLSELQQDAKAGQVGGTSATAGASGRHPTERTWKSPLPANYDARVEVKNLEAALKGSDNEWKGIRGHATLDRLNWVKTEAKAANPEAADELVVRFFEQVLKSYETRPKNVEAFHQKMAAEAPAGGIEMTTDERRFSPVLYEYPKFLAVPDGKATSDYGDNLRALDLLNGPKDPKASWTHIAGATPDAYGFSNMFGISIKDSPWVDGGYDVRDYYKIQKELGPVKFKAFMKEMMARNMSYSADGVFNHVSREHRFARDLMAGDVSKLPYFIDWTDTVKVGETVEGHRTYNLLRHTAGPDAGKTSKVWQIFPDSNPDSLVPVDVPGVGTRKLYASFMPQQWDLNAFNPDVFAYQLGAMSHDVNNGMRGIRLDAIIHIGKEAGTNQIDLPKTHALMGLYKAFLSDIAPGTITIPEANLDPAVAKAGWLDPQRKFDGKVENTAGDALISFEGAAQAGSTPITGDKTGLVNFIKARGQLPANKTQWVMPGKGHDEFMPTEEAFQTLKDEGFPVFADRGFGNTMYELYGHDPLKVRQAVALAYQMGATPVIKPDLLIPRGDDKEFFEKQKDMRLDQMKAQGQQPDEVKAADLRDLGRGPVRKKDLEDALKSGYPVATFVAAMNALWAERPSVRGRDIQEVPNADKSVLTWAIKDAGGRDVPLLTLNNLTDDVKTAHLLKSDLAKLLGWDEKNPSALHDILQERIGGKASPVSFKDAGDAIDIQLEPRAVMYVQAGEAKRV